MIRESMAQADLTVWPQIALVFFIVFFVAVGLWTFIKGRNHGFDKIAAMPLEDSAWQELEGATSAQSTLKG